MSEFIYSKISCGGCFNVMRASIQVVQGVCLESFVVNFMIIDIAMQEGGKYQKLENAHYSNLQ